MNVFLGFAGILTFIVVLAILILVHELGHFSMAKLFGVRVDEFGLGFPPRLKSWRRGRTLYSINLIPLGGFVRMRGENGENDEPDSFGSKPQWQRFIVLVAGPAMNLILAMAVFFVTFMGGSPRALAVVTGIAPNSPAAHAGLRPGDRVIRVAGKPVQWYEDVAVDTQAHLGKPTRLVVLRNGHQLGFRLVPRLHPPRNQGAMGIILGKTAVVRYSPLTAVNMSFQQLGGMVASVPAVVQAVSAGKSNQVSGPIGIAHMTSGVVNQQSSERWGQLFYLVALLSANLGVLNLLPIPALDGGRIVFVLISWVRRRNLDPQVEGMIHLTGMAVLMFLIMVVSYHDIARWVAGSAY